MSKLWIGTKGTRFVDADGRQVILRGVNLGGDCKLPYPDGGTDRPSDFADHETVCFVGRPFPLEEADEHLGRIAGWGFNLLRLVVTWEAVAHAGPDQMDQAYVEYIGRVCERAQAHGLAVLVDFHQDVWSRMSGGSGAPGWLFAKLGLDFRAFDAADAAHVMQRRYDYASSEQRQEHRYPMMSWPQNYRMPVNGILWSAFFAGATLTPDWRVDGRNVQDYLQGQYLGAVRALAQRLRELPNVIGFDTLNEPGLGWIGQRLSEQRIAPNADDPSQPFAGPAWSALDGLKVARGLPAAIPLLSTTDDEGGVAVTGSLEANPNGISIWLPGAADPFEQAGAWRLENGQALALDEDFFRSRQGRKFDAERDFMGPFFQRVAETIRGVRPDWLLFAEINPYVLMKGRTFPPAMPPATVNAVHWYDIQLLRSKKFDPDMDAAARQALRKRYFIQLGYMRSLG
ncbi:MAG TPA: cellulase family glycosylhydrolase, partial [Nevskia sp.]|nr:cellulase family glycosylhydrolase [Nevskia sp.]